MIVTPPQPTGYFELPPEWDKIALAAAEKIPLKDAHRQLAAKFTAELDAALQMAVERYLGHPLTDAEAIVGRLTNVRVQSEAGETYCMDGVPVLWAGDVVVDRVDNTLQGSRELVHLYGGTGDAG